jgi:hypothetical protein
MPCLIQLNAPFFAHMNLQAGLKAIAVPDFAGAAKYAKDKISFLGYNCWETEYDLSIGLYKTAVLSHFQTSQRTETNL